MKGNCKELGELIAEYDFGHLLQKSRSEKEVERLFCAFPDRSIGISPIVSPRFGFSMTGFIVDKYLGVVKWNLFTDFS